jgi:hypothetical protein
MMKRLLAVAAVAFAAASTGMAQQQKLEIKSIDIDNNALTPEYNIGVGPQKKAPSQKWLWVEVGFTYQDASRDPKPIDDLKFTFYILLNDKTRENPKGTLLVGSVNLTGVTPGGPSEIKRTVMLVSPQVLKRFFGGKVPPNLSSATQAIGVTAQVQGQVVAQESIGLGKGKPDWWTQFQQGPPGLVLSKDQTPFAPLFYDYFEATKPQTPGAY